MNCKIYKQRILLADSGELAGTDLQDLEKHIQACHECQSYRRTVGTIIATVRGSLSESEPSLAVKARIHTMAHDAIPSNVVIFRRRLIRILAYAAVIVATISGIWMISPEQSKFDSIENMHSIVAMISNEQTTAYSDKPELQSLATQLLLMEGLSTDVNSDFLTSENFWEQPDV